MDEIKTIKGYLPVCEKKKGKANRLIRKMKYYGASADQIGS